MKKTIILASFALMAAFSSCNKSEMPEAATTDGIKLNITVADLNPETKAVKSGWENGDRLNLFFDGWNNSANEDNFQKEPDMILKYDGSKWQIESQVASLSTRLKSTGGKFTALWESSNDLMNYPNVKWYGNSVWYYPLWTAFNYENYGYKAYHSYLLVSSPGIGYTFDGSTLTANISTWKFNTKFKVLIKTNDDTVKANAGDLVLQVKGGDTYAATIGETVINYQFFLNYVSNGAANSIGFQGAVAESDGLAFYYKSCQATESDNIVFTLIDTSNGNKKQYTVTGKSLTTDTFKAISIDYSKFKEGAADIPDGCVDLGLSVYWASCNLGASKPTEYGDYYQWAGTEDVSDTGINLDWSYCPYHTGSDSGTGWTKYNTKSSYGTVDNKTVLDPMDDAASVALGGKWRMPTDEEWTELRNTDNCSWTWTTIDGVNGYKVQSKKSGYTDNWIFLPAAGSRRGTDLSLVGSGGYYWSSSLNTGGPNLAWYVYFYSDNVSRYRYNRCNGQSVRPVSE